MAAVGAFGPVLRAGHPSSSEDPDATEIRSVRWLLGSFVFLFILSIFMIFNDEEQEDKRHTVQVTGTILIIMSFILLFAALGSSRCFNVFRPTRRQVLHNPDEMDPERFSPRLLSLSPIDYIFKILGCKENRVARSPPVRFEVNNGEDILDLHM